MNEVTFQSNGRILHGKIVAPSGDGGSKRLLFVHGLNSDQSGYLPRAAAASAALHALCLTFDLSGHGASSGVFDDLTPTDHLGDALAAYDYLVSLGDSTKAKVGV